MLFWVIIRHFGVPLALAAGAAYVAAVALVEGLEAAWRRLRGLL